MRPFKAEKRRNCHWQLQNGDKMLGNTTLDLENESLKKLKGDSKIQISHYSCVSFIRESTGSSAKQVNVVS